jgi:hypothetical protein
MVVPDMCGGFRKLDKAEIAVGAGSKEGFNAGAGNRVLFGDGRNCQNDGIRMDLLVGAELNCSGTESFLA